MSESELKRVTVNLTHAADLGAQALQDVLRCNRTDAVCVGLQLGGVVVRLIEAGATVSARMPDGLEVPLMPAGMEHFYIENLLQRYQPGQA
jgi:hypothetical protein